MKFEVFKEGKWVECRSIKRNDKFRTVSETEYDFKEYLAKNDAFCDHSSGQWLIEIVKDNI